MRLRAAADMNFAEGTLVERGRRRDERHRHRARGRPRRPGVRPRALRRPGPALDVQRVPDPRPGHGRGDRRDRPHGRAEHRPPALASPSPPPPRAPSRPASSSPCRSATRACRPATAPASHRTAARSSPRTGRTIGAVPRGWKLTGRLAIPPGGGELRLPSGAHAVAEPVDATLEAFVVHALESKRVTSISRPAREAALPRPRPRRAGHGREGHRRCARAWPRSSRCCARTRTG